MKRTQKMRVARECLERRLEEEKRAIVSELRATTACAAKLDRMRVSCTEKPTAALRAVPRFQSGKACRILQRSGDYFKPYCRAHWFHSKSSGMKFSIESKPRAGWLAPYRITLIADDDTGLLPEEVFAVLEVLPDFELLLVEISLDFKGE